MLLSRWWLVGLVALQTLALVLAFHLYGSGRPRFLLPFPYSPSAFSPLLPPPPPPLPSCARFPVPGVTPPPPPHASVDSSGLFSYLTSYTWIPQARTLYITSLGQNFFLRERDVLLKRNKSLDLAFNQSFPYTSLVNPAQLVQLARWGSQQAQCHNVRSAQKDIVLIGKIYTLKCEFNSTDDDKVITLHSNDNSSSSSDACWEFDVSDSARGGALAEHTTRVAAAATTSVPFSSPSLVVCLSGLQTYTSHAREIIQQQMRELHPAHIYLGLNTHDTRVRDEYLEALWPYVSTGTLSIIPPPAPATDVTFTQAKLPFLNECLMHAKLHGDLFAGVWDVDEIPKRLTLPSNATTTLAQHLVSLRPQLELNTCYVRMLARNCMTAKYSARMNTTTSTGVSLLLGERFQYENAAYCANYTKAIVVVPRVELVGIHLPEHCDLYPVKGKFSVSRAMPEFILPVFDVVVAHFVQLFSPRYTFCPTIPSPHQFCEKALSKA